MGRIDDLIQQYCPEGVQMVQLGKVASISRGVRVVKAELTTEGKFPVYQNSLKPLGYLDKSNTCANTTFVISAGAAGEIGFSNTDFWAADDCLKIDCGKFLLPKLVFHYLLNIQPSIKRHVRKASVPRLSRAIIEKIEIPLPPLPVQEAIVEILDKFDRLSAELQAELQARKQQYEYYRNQLLTRFAPNQPVTEYSLGEIADLRAGKAIKASELGERDESHLYPCFGGNGIRGYISKNSHQGKYPIIGRQGALCGCVNWAEGKFYATEHAVVVSPKNGNNPRYLYYMLEVANLNQYKSQGAQPGLSVSNLNELKFNIPPLSEQSRIVAILDKFEALVNDLSQGLPAEIAAVQEQYEYYRNQLLTFKTKE